MYKLFCVLGCGWSSIVDDETLLWDRYAACPKCHGATDGHVVDFPKQLPKPRSL